jgi:hypothetical protein
MDSLSHYVTFLFHILDLLELVVVRLLIFLGFCYGAWQILSKLYNSEKPLQTPYGPQVHPDDTNSESSYGHPHES